jgi:hypothetical protein
MWPFFPEIKRLFEFAVQLQYSEPKSAMVEGVQNGRGERGI